MSDRENSAKMMEEAKETDTRTESTSMEETKGRDPDTVPSESDVRTDRSHETDPKSSGEKRVNATQTRHKLRQSIWLPVRSGVEDCHYYLQTGRCGFGQRCRFNHPPLPESSQMRHDMVQPSPYPVRPQLPESSQTRHDMAQPSPYPVRSQLPESSQMRHDMAQPSPCPVRPQLPESSQMRHDMVQPSSHPGARECRQYLQTGQCSYGPNCRFNHPPPTHLEPVLPDMVSRPICKFFQRGNCKYGSGCKFTHSMSGDGAAEPMRQATTWGKKFHEKRHGAKSRSRAWKRERQGHDLEEQKQKKRKVENLRTGPTVQSGEGGSQTEQRLEIPENPNVIAQGNQQEEQADMERQNREAQEKAEEERRQQIDNARRQARLRLERMRPRVLTSNVDQLRDALPDIGIERKEGDGF